MGGEASRCAWGYAWGYGRGYAWGCAWGAGVGAVAGGTEARSPSQPAGSRRSSENMVGDATVYL